MSTSMVKTGNWETLISTVCEWLALFPVCSWHALCFPCICQHFIVLTAVLVWFLLSFVNFLSFHFISLVVETQYDRLVILIGLNYPAPSL